MLSEASVLAVFPMGYFVLYTRGVSPHAVRSTLSALQGTPDLFRSMEVVGRHLPAGLPVMICSHTELRPPDPPRSIHFHSTSHSVGSGEQN